MKKRTFVPSADHLESRIALTGGVKFIGGVPVLTTQALNATYAAIHAAYTSFATHTPLQYFTLQANLGNAVSRIPFNVRDGLRAEVEAEVPFLHDDIKAGVPQPVIRSWKFAKADVTDFVNAEVKAGVIILV
jgi:hypothetical protein